MSATPQCARNCFCGGSVTGYLGSANQISHEGELAKELIHQSVAIFEELHRTQQLIQRRLRFVTAEEALTSCIPLVHACGAQEPNLNRSLIGCIVELLSPAPTPCACINEAAAMVAEDGITRCRELFITATVWFLEDLLANRTGPSLWTEL